MAKIPFTMGMEISKTYEIKSIQRIRRDFFKYHVVNEGKKRVASRPNALVMNPPKVVRIEDEFSQDIWIAVYCRGFYIQIEKNIHKIGGPHAAKLFIQVYPGKVGSHQGKFVHLGTTQFMFNFFDKKKLQKKLSKALRFREYFATENLEETLIEFDEPQPKSITV